MHRDGLTFDSDRQPWSGKNELSWADRYRQAGLDWADKEAAAQLLEDTKSAVMAQRQVALGDIPVNRAEQTVKSSPEWYDHVTKIVEARKAANLAKVHLEATRIEFMQWQAGDANKRAEMRMT